MTNPSQNTTVSSIALIATRQKELHKTDEQLAHELGFENSKVITMIKQGTMKLPIKKIPLVASALSIDAAYLLRLVLSENMPDVLSVIDALSTPLVLSADEIKVIQSIRQLSNGQEVCPTVVDGKSIVALLVA